MSHKARFILFAILATAIFATACGDNNPFGDDDSDKTAATQSNPEVIQAQDPNPSPTATPTATAPAAECTKFDSGNGDNHVNNGVTIPAGSCAITEVLDHAAKTETLFAGKIPSDFKVGVEGSIHRNAWSGFESVNKAKIDMCTSTVPERKGQYGSYKFTVNPDCGDGKAPGTPSSTATTTPPKTVEVPKNNGEYVRLTGECKGTIPTGDGHVLGIDGGATVPAGTLAVVRYVNNNRAEEHIEYGCLLNDTTAGKVSLIATDIWTGYEASRKAYAGACNQGIADVKDSLKNMSWNMMYDIWLLDIDGKSFVKVPATCPN